jgi:hypothetical protein
MNADGPMTRSGRVATRASQGGVSEELERLEGLGELEEIEQSCVGDPPRARQ